MSTPFSRTDIAALRKAHATLSQAEKDVEDAERAGVNVDDIKPRLAQLKEVEAKLRAVYGQAT